VRTAATASIVVVKLGGTTLAEQTQTLRDVAQRSRTQRIVLVHGGGKRLTEWLGRMGVESRFEGGLRVTDDAALEVALGVLRGVINAELVAVLRDMGADAAGWSGVDGATLRGDRVSGLGRVVSISEVRTELLDLLLERGAMPVVAPAALDLDGVICNVNADDAAAALAGALGARLVLLTDADGVRDAGGQRIPTLTTEASERLIAAGVIAGGMVPKVRCAVRAIDSGARQVVIADGAAIGALDRALDDAGFGTRWTAPRLVSATAGERLIDSAQVGDVPGITGALAAGASIETRDTQGCTPLLLAVMGDHVPAARVLVAAGADVNAQDGRSESPFLATGVTGSVAMLEALLPGRPDTRITNRFGGVAVIPAAERGHVAYLDAVLRLTDIDVNHVNRMGWSALLEAVLLSDGGPRHQDVVRVLLAHEADPRLADLDGRTPLDHARALGYTNIAELLMAADG
jgi:acetylglutamate kinase